MDYLRNYFCLTLSQCLSLLQNQLHRRVRQICWIFVLAQDALDHRRLQEAVKASDGLPPLRNEPTHGTGAGTFTVFVDGLRYDMAV